MRHEVIRSCSVILCSFDRFILVFYWIKLMADEPIRARKITHSSPHWLTPAYQYFNTICVKFCEKNTSLAHGVKVEGKGQIRANHLKLSGNLCYSVSHFCYLCCTSQLNFAFAPAFVYKGLNPY